MTKIITSPTPNVLAKREQDFSSPLVKLDATPDDYSVPQLRLCQGELKEAPHISEGDAYENQAMDVLYKAVYAANGDSKPMFQPYVIGPMVPLIRLEDWSIFRDGKLLAKAETERELERVVDDPNDMSDARMTVYFYSVFEDEVSQSPLAVRFTPASHGASKSILTKEKERSVLGKTFGAYTLGVAQVVGTGLRYFRLGAVRVSDPSETLFKKACLWREILGERSVSVIDEDVKAESENEKPGTVNKDGIPF